jgi:hypothetical protein
MNKTYQIRVENSSGNDQDIIFEIERDSVLRYITSQLSNKKKFPQLRLENFLPEAQDFLQQIKGLQPQTRMVLRSKYSELISHILIGLEFLFLFRIFKFN